MTGSTLRAALAVAILAAGAQAREKGDKTISVEYDGAVLVVATADGVAAFTFTERVDKGTGYKFRFRPADGGKEQTGTGEVFERYKAVQGPGGPNDVQYLYAGGELWLTAGPVKVLWSRGGVNSGWLYFNPDKVGVETVAGADLKALDLKRFAR